MGDNNTDRLCIDICRATDRPSINNIISVKDCIHQWGVHALEETHLSIVAIIAGRCVEHAGDIVVCLEVVEVELIFILLVAQGVKQTIHILITLIVIFDVHPIDKWVFHLK